MMEGSFIKVLNLFPNGVKIFFYSLLISDCNLASKRVQGETRLQEGVLKRNGKVVSSKRFLSFYGEKS